MNAQDELNAIRERLLDEMGITEPDQWTTMQLLDAIMGDKRAAEGMATMARKHWHDMISAHGKLDRLGFAVERIAAALESQQPVAEPEYILCPACGSLDEFEVTGSVISADGQAFPAQARCGHCGYDFAVSMDARHDGFTTDTAPRQQQPAPPQGRTVSKVADEIMVYYTPDSEPFCPTCGETTLRAQGGHCWHCAKCGATFHLGIVADTEPLRKAAEEALAKEAAAQDWKAKYEVLAEKHETLKLQHQALREMHKFEIGLQPAPDASDAGDGDAEAPDWRILAKIERAISQLKPPAGIEAPTYVQGFGTARSAACAVLRRYLDPADEI